jgi:hypothetical protein
MRVHLVNKSTIWPSESVTSLMTAPGAPLKPFPCPPPRAFHVEAHDDFVAQVFKVAGHDALGQASTMAVLPAGLAEKRGCFFGGEDLYAADFLVAANHGSIWPRRTRHEVHGVAVQAPYSGLASGQTLARHAAPGRRPSNPYR